MPLQLFEDAMGDKRNALFLAHAANDCYYPIEQGGPMFKEKLGLDARLLSVGNTQCYVGTNDEHIVLAFRGTESPTTIDGLKDMLLTDACNLLIVPEGRLGVDLIAAGVGAKFHKGFADATADIWPSVLEAVKAELAKSERPIWVTGHSLGGALALFASWLLARQFISVHQIYTFGAPMIGNNMACEAFNREFRGKIFRYVHGPDPVPQLPTVSMVANDYGHVQTEVPVGESAPSIFAGFLSKAVDGLLSLSLINELWTYVTERVGAHAMDKYIKLLEGE